MWCGRALYRPLSGGKRVENYTRVSDSDTHRHINQPVIPCDLGKHGVARCQVSRNNKLITLDKERIDPSTLDALKEWRHGVATTSAWRRRQYVLRTIRARKRHLSTENTRIYLSWTRVNIHHGLRWAIIPVNMRRPEGCDGWFDWCTKVPLMRRSGE